MVYRESQAASRARCLTTYDEAEAEQYDRWVTLLTDADHDACINDISNAFPFRPGMSVLDAGAGTGALTLALQRYQGLQIAALEPSPCMARLLTSKPALATIPVTRAFCDHPDDRSTFSANSFDVIASRLLVNCLYDPLAAFQNWYYWLRPGGGVVIMDGLFGREAWTGAWQDAVDTLPLSVCQTTAAIPYLLEKSGFCIRRVGLMQAVNARPSTRTRRYLVVATKDAWTDV